MSQPDVVAAAKQWVQWDPNPKTKEVIERLLEPEPQNDELEHLFGTRLAFGTAGLRGPMAPGSSGINDLVVLQTAQGICAYAVEQFGIELLRKQGVIFGYDHRQKSEIDISSKRFAEISAAVFLSQGVPVYLFSEIVATPFVPFGIVRKQCCLGVMVTASHNPKDDNGYKIYWNDGVQITPPHDTGISKAISENLEPWEAVTQKLVGFKNEAVNEQTEDPTAELTSDYYKHNKELLCRHPEGSDQFEIVYTAMHGVGYKWAKLTFEAFDLPPFIPVKAQVEPDPSFPTVRKPNPEEKGALDEAKRVATSSGRECNKLILANDPDADRLAVAEYDASSKTWSEFSGNEIGIMFAHWQWINRSRTGEETDPQKYAMLTTAVSTQMLSRMAEVEGFRYEETLTGFKWLGASAGKLAKEGLKVLFCFEEAIGYCLSDRVFDKDGLTAAAAFAELATQTYNKGQTISLLMQSLYEKYGHFVSQNDYFIYSKPQVVTDIFCKLRNSGRYGFICGKLKVERIVDVTLGFDSDAKDGKAKFPVTPGSQMIVFYFSNHCVITLRTSGTEPKIKYYCEMCGQPGESRDQVVNELEATVRSFVDSFIEPEKHGLQ